MSDTYFRASVGAYILNPKYQLLLVQKDSYNGSWHVVKGGIETGEDLETALRREIHEETGVDDIEIITKSKLDLIHTTFHKYNIPHVERIGQATSMFWVMIEEQELAIPNDELDNYIWIDVTPDNLRKYFGTHDNTDAVSTYLPLELEEIKKVNLTTK